MYAGVPTKQILKDFVHLVTQPPDTEVNVWSSTVVISV